MIRKEAWKACRKYGKIIRRDFQDFEAVGNLTFCRAAALYDNGLSAFSTYFTKYLQCEFRQYVRRELKHCLTLNIDEIPELIEDTDRELHYIELKCGLTNDSLYMIGTITEMQGRITKRALIEALADEGWTLSRTRRAMSEIKRALSA